MLEVEDGMDVRHQIVTVERAKNRQSLRSDP